jgi:hypothetical protein
MEEWSDRSKNSQHRHYMGLSVQLDTPAASFMRKYPILINFKIKVYYYLSTLHCKLIYLYWLSYISLTVIIYKQTPYSAVTLEKLTVPQSTYCLPFVEFEKSLPPLQEHAQREVQTGKLKSTILHFVGWCTARHFQRHCCFRPQCSPRKFPTLFYLDYL